MLDLFKPVVVKIDGPTRKHKAPTNVRPLVMTGVEIRRRAKAAAKRAKAGKDRA